MKIIGKFFFILGVLFWSVFLSIDLFGFLSLNGVGKLFPFDTPEVTSLQVERDSAYVNISYSYKVDSIENHNSYKMVNKYYENCNVDTLIIKYNRIFPSVSYIENIPLKLRQAKIGIFLSSFFLMFTILLWKLSNRNKSVEVYEEVGNRPWLYPDDKSIKNPWKRLMNRLFQK